MTAWPSFFRTQILYFLRLKSSWYATISGFYNAPIGGSFSENYFRQYIVLLPRGPGFDSTSVHVRFVIERVTLGQVFLWVHRFFSRQYRSANILYSFIHSIESSTTLQNLSNWQRHWTTHTAYAYVSTQLLHEAESWLSWQFALLVKAATICSRMRAIPDSVVGWLKVS